LKSILIGWGYPVDTVRMDIITVLQPENAVRFQRRLPRVSVKTISDRTNGFSIDGIRDQATFSSLLLPLCMALLFSLTPVFQHFYGGYRVAVSVFPADNTIETALQNYIFPETVYGNKDHQFLPLPSSLRPVEYTEYRVRNGDTVSGIASRFGLRNISTVLSANHIDNARRIRAGQQLRIPSMDGILHTVARGESLEQIGSRYAISVTALLDANDLNSDRLQYGQTLFIPGATLAPNELRKALGELFIMPIQGRLTSPFGYRADPFTGVRTFHTGIDLAAPTGTPVKVTLDGRVVATGFTPVYGNYIIISHDDGYQSLYAHLSSIGVRRGQSVAQSAVIGRVGNTGYSTGSHLHFSVYKNGRMIDPLSVLR